MFRRALRYSQKTFRLYRRLKEIKDRRIKPRISAVKVAIYIFSLQLSNLGSLNNFSQSVTYPSVSTVARSADTMSIDDVRDVNMDIYRKARASKMLAPFRGKWIGVVDGKEITTSEYKKCSHCKKRKLRDKEGELKYQYYHQFVAFILACSGFSLTLDIEPILPGEGEVTSAYRLLSRVCENYPRAFSVVIGDGLYLNGKTFKLLEAHHKKTIAVLKEERRQLYEEAVSLTLMTEPKVYKQGTTSYRVWEHTISGCWEGYGKDVRVIVSEETTTKRVHSRHGKGWEDKTEVSHWMWATNLDISNNIGDLKNMVKVCHSRWHIENRCFKEAADMWNADHIYRHSANGIMVFLLFLFMAVNIFNIFRSRNLKDKKIRTKLNLIKKIQADFLSLARPLPPIPI
jgi:hypothetical protein